MVWILLPWWVSFSDCDCSEVIFMFVLSSFGGLDIQGKITKEVIVLMKFSTTKGDVLIVYFFFLVFILIFQSY